MLKIWRIWMNYLGTSFKVTSKIRFEVPFGVIGAVLIHIISINVPMEVLTFPTKFLLIKWLLFKLLSIGMKWMKIVVFSTKFIFQILNNKTIDWVNATDIKLMRMLTTVLTFSLIKFSKWGPLFKLTSIAMKRMKIVVFFNKVLFPDIE